MASVMTVTAPSVEGIVITDYGRLLDGRPVKLNRHEELQKLVEDLGLKNRYECNYCYSVTGDPDRCPSCGAPRSG
jgi:hypothetical protein